MNLNAALNELEKKFQGSTNHQRLLQKKLDDTEAELNNKVIFKFLITFVILYVKFLL